MKTNRAAAKRFKVTTTGKITRRHTRLGHLMTKKSASRKRRLKRTVEVFKSQIKTTKRLIPYSI